MKRIFFAIFVLGLAAAGFSASTSSGSVAVFYEGNTPVNTDTLHFLDKQFSEQSSGYRLVPVQNPNEIQSGRYKAILVLNTGLTEGIDERLASFIESRNDKSRIMLISLRRASSDLQIQTADPSPATLGVDAVTAASQWKGRGLLALFGGGNSATYDMHVSWVKHVLSWIDQL